MQIKILHGYRLYSDAKLETFALFVLSCMTNNPKFINPVPDLATLQQNITDYQTSLSAAQTRDTVKASLKNDSKKLLITTLDNLSVYVLFTSGNDRSAVKSAGYVTNKEKRTTVPLGDIENFSVVPGQNPGEMISSVDPVEGADSYLHLFCQSPNTGGLWRYVQSKSPSQLLTGLKPGMLPWDFRVEAMGSKSKTVQTDIITKIVV